MGIVCKIDTCDRTDIKAFGLCNKHYKRLQYRKKHGLNISNLKDRLPRSKEHIENLKKSHPRTNSLKGKTYEEIYGDKAEYYRGLKSGENSAAWKGGKSLEEYGQKFNYTLKETIRDRDNRRCRLCGCPEIELETKLSIHHIDENKRNNNRNNLISLCKECHGKIHWSKDDWANHLRDLIKQMEVLL
jgi:5-methylcytosine-specific restriction endonuclease McrA